MTTTQPASPRSQPQPRQAVPSKGHPSKTELDHRYGRIGISAVAAAIPFQNELRGPDCAQRAPTTYFWSLAVAE
jgi:hypothetical protein